MTFDDRLVHQEIGHNNFHSRIMQEQFFNETFISLTATCRILLLVKF